MPQAKCPLCLQTKEIVISHLIPAAMYKVLRERNSEPVQITSTRRSTRAVQTSQQMQCPLLCLDCEGLLNRGGENWLLPLLANKGGVFPLRDILSTHEPSLEINQALVYEASRNPEIKVEKLAHFAMGIFWKASLHSWGVEPGELLINLGKYREQVRTYLRNETPFPEKIALLVAVLPASASKYAFCTPQLKSRGKYHLYTFYALGIQFVLLVGNCVNRKIKETCFVSNPAHPMLVNDFSKDIIENQLGPTLAGAKLSRGMIKRVEQMRKR